jgi:uncharacterized membrane protein
MDQQQVIRAAMAGLVAAGLSGAAIADGDAPKGMEKCYGIAKAGQNDCGSATGTHACAGMSKVSNDPNEYKFVKAGTCVKMGGKLKAAGKKG